METPIIHHFEKFVYITKGGLSKLQYAWGGAVGVAILSEELDPIKLVINENDFQLYEPGALGLKQNPIINVSLDNLVKVNYYPPKIDSSVRSNNGCITSLVISFIIALVIFQLEHSLIASVLAFFGGVIVINLILGKGNQFKTSKDKPWFEFIFSIDSKENNIRFCVEEDDEIDILTIPRYVNRPITGNIVTPASNYYFRARRKFDKKEYNSAMLNIKQAISLKPNDPEYHFRLACFYSQLSDKQNTFLYLSNSVNFGLADILDKIRKEDSLGYIRSQPEFQEFISNGFKLPI